MSYLQGLKELFPSWSESGLLSRACFEVEQHQELLKNAVAELDAMKALCVRKDELVHSFKDTLLVLTDCVALDNIKRFDEVKSQVRQKIDESKAATPADLRDCVTVHRSRYDELQAQVSSLTKRVGNLEAELLKEIQANAALTKELRVASESSLINAQRTLGKQNECATLRQQNAELVAALEWRTGIPDVPEGGQRPFLCKVNGGGHCILLYSNRYIAPASDTAEPAMGTEANDDGDYFWTGWFEESCVQCDTFWSWAGTIDGWMPLPLPALASRGEQEKRP